MDSVRGELSRSDVYKRPISGSFKAALLFSAPDGAMHSCSSTFGLELCSKPPLGT